jgi:hypothetical protein
VQPVKCLARLLATLWLIAALSLVGWLIVNLDIAGWILVGLTTGLMTLELTRRPVRGRGTARRARSRKLPDEHSRP